MVSLFIFSKIRMHNAELKFNLGQKGLITAGKEHLLHGLPKFNRDSVDLSDLEAGKKYVIGWHFQSAPDRQIILRMAEVVYSYLFCVH